MSCRRRIQSVGLASTTAPPPFSTTFEAHSMIPTLLLLSSVHVTTVIALLLPGAESAALTLRNSCQREVWPGLMSNAGQGSPPTTGFQLRRGEEKVVLLPPSWSGRLWARTLCTTDGGGRFSCATGDCASGKLECSGGGATPPATLVEFTFGAAGGTDFYDVSLVDGYNVPITVVPEGGSASNCSVAGCSTDVNRVCQPELRLVSAEGEVVACRSACDAFGSEEYCCSGTHANPNTCHATSYSESFKKVCPRAYSYAYDDSSSTFTCSNAETYRITFCNSSDSKGDIHPREENTSSDPTKHRPSATMVYMGDDDHIMDGGATTNSPSIIALVVVALSMVMIRAQ